MLAPSSEPMAVAAPVDPANSMNAKPRLCPLARSMTSDTRMMGRPRATMKSRNPPAVTFRPTFPMYNRLFIGLHWMEERRPMRSTA